MPIQPDWFKKQLDDFRGGNIYGTPVLRVVWGAEQRDHNGKLKYIDPSTNKPMERWILERWQPAGFFGSRKDWEDTNSFYDDIKQTYVNLKGAFPERGAYVMICPIVGNEGQYVPLDETALQAIKLKVRQDEQFAEMQGIERDALVLADHQQQQNAQEAVADKRQEYIREYALKNWDKENRSTSRAYNFTPR